MCFVYLSVYLIHQITAGKKKMTLDQIRARLEISNIAKVAKEIGIDRGILDRILIGKGRGPHKRSIDQVREYFLKVDSGVRFK